MNTPTHIIISHGVLSDSRVKKLTIKENWAIFLGAFLPDAAIYVLFFYALIVGIDQSILWNEVYFTPFWTNLVDYFNSIPITAILILVGVWKKWRWLWLYGASSSLHIIADFFTHSSDAHQHFLPFSTWTFESPVSYWESGKYNEIVAVVELIIFAVSSWYVRKQIKSPKWKKIFTVVTSIWIFLSIVAAIVFTFFSPQFSS